MLVSLNWLRHYVRLTASPRDIASTLTSLGFEVESLKIAGEGVTGVIVAEVRSREKHPEADKLSVCRVFDGEQEWQVVCGAPNVAAGQKVLFARVGAKLPGGFSIKKAKLRGVESFGMICAEDEVGLGEGHDGIFILPDDAVTGMPMHEIEGLCDVQMEVNVTPNRPDALSHLGLARELAAHYRLELNVPSRVLREGSEPVQDAVRLEVSDDASCPHYVGRVIEGVTVGESPAWLKTALRSVGKTPINNVVDITNFVLLEWGQPSHAFDLDTLSGAKIEVRRAREGETLTTLDGVERRLTSQDCIIADAEKPQVLAGVMGGTLSGVSPATQRIFLETAYFQPTMVRLQARRHGLSTDSSYRFERGIDYLTTAGLSDYIAASIAEVTGGQVRRGRLESESPLHPKQAPVVPLRPDRMRKLLGVNIPTGEMAAMLAGIGIAQAENPTDGEKLYFKIPGYRGDIAREADLIEEVARLYDFNRIQGALPSFTLGAGSLTPREQLSRTLRHVLADLGLQEAMHLRFTSQKLLAKLGLPAEDIRLNPIRLQNPLSEDWEVMPTTGLPNMLQSLLHNQNNQQADVALFEIGKAFFPQPKTKARDNGNREEALLTLAMMGAWPAGDWQGEAREVDFYILKGLIQNLFRRLHRPLRFGPGCVEPFLHPKESLDIFVQDGQESIKVGWMGILHPRSQQPFDLKRKVAVAELSLDSLLRLPEARQGFKAYSLQVASLRDFNAIVPETMRHEELLGRFHPPAILENIGLRSIYRGAGIPEGHKAMHYELVFRHPERSLTDEEVQAAHEGIKAEIAADGLIRFN